MKTYPSLSTGKGKHKVKYTLQINEYKGSFTKTIFGDFKGAMLFDVSALDLLNPDVLKRLEYDHLQLRIVENQDEKWLCIRFLDDNGEIICSYDASFYESGEFFYESVELKKMIVNIEIVEYQQNTHSKQDIKGFILK